MIWITLQLLMGLQVEILYMCQEVRTVQTLSTYEHMHADGTVHRFVLVAGPCRAV